MSFNRASNLEAQPTTFRREDDPQYSDDPEFQQRTTALSRQLFELTSKVSQLSRDLGLMGTSRETKRVRERVHDLRSDTSQGLKEVADGLKKLLEETNPEELNPQQKWTLNKLKRDLQSTLEEFNVHQETAKQKQEAANAELRRQQDADGSGEGGQGSQQEQQEQQQEQLRLADQDEVDFQEQLIVERETEIRNIESSVLELNELFTDVATMVAEQGHVVDDISSNIQTTRDDTRNADQELRAANRYQKSARSKACCLLLILAIVVIIIVLAVVVG